MFKARKYIAAAVLASMLMSQFSGSVTAFATEGNEIPAVEQGVDETAHNETGSYEEKDAINWEEEQVSGEAHEDVIAGGDVSSDNTKEEESSSESATEQEEAPDEAAVKDHADTASDTAEEKLEDVSDEEYAGEASVPDEKDTGAAETYDGVIRVSIAGKGGTVEIVNNDDTVAFKAERRTDGTDILTDAAGNTAETEDGGFVLENAETKEILRNEETSWLDLNGTGLFALLYEDEAQEETFDGFEYVSSDGTGRVDGQVPDLSYDEDSNIYISVPGARGNRASVVVRSEEGYVVSEYSIPYREVEKDDRDTEMTIDTEYEDASAEDVVFYVFSLEKEGLEEQPEEKEESAEPVKGADETAEPEKNGETEEASDTGAEDSAENTEEETVSEDVSAEEAAGEEIPAEETVEKDDSPVYAVKEDAEDSETQKEVQEEKEEYYKEYTYSDEQAVITAVVAEKDVIPETAEFICRPIDIKSDEYIELRQKMTELYGTTEDAVEIYPYDISFESDGKKIEPDDGKVIIKFEMKDPIQVTDKEDVSVVHIKENEDTEILSDDIVTGGEIASFEVEMEDFSPVVITRTNVGGELTSAGAKSTQNGDVWISKTANINDKGTASTTYSNSANVTDTVSIEGATSLEVDITYGGESITYDWLYIKDKDGNILYTDARGKTVGSAASSNLGKIGGKNADFSGSSTNTTAPSNSVSYIFNTDTLRFTWRTDGSGVGYGYYAVITPTYATGDVPDFHFEELDDGTYALVFDKGGDIESFSTRQDIEEQIAPYRNLISEIRLHKGTTSIGNSAFRDLPALKTVTMPRNSQLTKIGRNAFKDCENLESISVPAGVASIGSDVFSGCRSLETVTFDAGNPMTELPEGLFKNCESLKNVTLPAGLQRVPASLFDGCTSLTDIDLPSSVTEIGSYAFRNTKITEFPLMENITFIGSYAFYGCTGLTDVTIPNSVSYIETSAFENCSNITDFVFEEGSPMTTLPARMFSGMSKLKNVILPDSLTRIPNYCFNNCSQLNMVSIPDTVTAIGDYAFSGCAKLQDFEIPSGVKTLGPYVFNGCTSLKDMSIPNTVTSVGSGLFYGCSNLIRAVYEDGSTVSSLPSSMFYGCSKLEFVKLPDGVKAIPASYFRGCSSLKHVDLPEDLTTIGDYAFYGCYNLEQADLPDTLKTVGTYAFYNCDKLTDITVPNSVTSIGTYAWGDCDGLRSFVFEEGSPITSMSTDILNSCDNLETLVLPDRITYIPNYLCSGCVKLADVTIPNRVTYIGTSAFNGCKALKTIDLPESVTSIYSSAFYGSGLEEITLPDNLGSIGSEAFRGTALKEIEIPNNVTSVGSRAFYSIPLLESVTFEEGGKNCSIGYEAFYGCSALKDTGLKENITSIGYRAFYNDTSITELTIPSTVTSIGYQAFCNNKGVKKLEFPASATNAALTIGASSNSTSGTFRGLTNVEEIVIDRNITSSNTLTDNFGDLNPNVKFTIGKHVDTLDNMIISCFTDKTEVVFEGENDFSVSTRMNNASEDVKWSELKGDFYVDPDGVVYKLNKSDGTASLFHIPAGIEEYTVPASVTSVAGREYNVTSVNSYAGRDADDLTSLAFEAPSGVTIPQFAFTGCGSLQTINEKTELYPEEWESVSLLCDFPVHSDTAPEQVLVIHDTTELGEAQPGEEPPRFSFGVTISGQEKMADDGLTYVYPTGMSARLDFAVSNESNIDMSDRVIRVYFAFDGDNYGLGNYPPGNYTLVNTATGSRYPFKVRETDAKGVYYYDITGFKPGDTLAFNNQFVYMSPKSGGGTMRIWAESISAQEAEEKEGKVSEPGKYILADWYTTPVPYNITKQVNGNPTFQYVANQNDEEDDNIYVKNVRYRINMTSSGASGTSYAKDFVEYVDFYDDIKLTDGMVWNTKIVDAVRNGDYYVSSSNYMYAKVDGKWTEICHMSFSSSDCVRGISCEVVTDDNGNDAIRIKWSYKNSYWTDVKTSPTADMPATTHDLYLGDLAIQVKRGSSLWQMLREGEEFTEEESEAMRQIANKVTETTHYSFSEDQTKDAEAGNRLVYLTTGFSMTKEMTGVTTFGREHGYKISLINSGLTHKDDIDIVEDSLREHYYIEPEDMADMFSDPKWGPYLRIDIASATLCSLPDAHVLDVYGNPAVLETAQQSGIEPIPYSGMAAAGTDISVTTAKAKLALYWNALREAVVLDVADDDGTVQNSYLIGPGKDFATIREAFDSIGYEVTYHAAYKVTWDLGDGYTLYMAHLDGVDVSDVSELTQQQISAYEYKLKSGRTDVFTIPSRTKKTTMWLTKDEPEAYPSSGISSSNTAYAKSSDGRQVGSANWSGHVYRELSLSKSAYADGKSWSSGIKIPDDTVIDYTLSFTNSGAEYDVLPLTDRMGGSQVLLVPVRNNRSALYYGGTGEGVELQDAELDTYTDGGIQYYILDKAGLYKGVTIDGRLADSIQVTKQPGSAVTLIKWYYQNVTGYSANASSVTRSITYKALADSARLGGKTEDEYGNTITSSAIANETWLGGHQTHRLYDSLYGETEQMQFIKWIVEDPEASRENLIRHSLVQDGDSVLYKIVVRNTGESEALMTGRRLYDILPSTSGIFAWSKNNVTAIDYVTEGLGTSVSTTGPEYWYIDSIQPGTGADTASRGLYYIHWNNDFSIHFDPKSEIWIYVTLKFPGSDDIDPDTGDSDNKWDDYIARNSGAIITNYFYIDQRNSSVTHELVDVVEGKIQKGVLDTGLSRSGYFQSEDTRHFYQNGGNVDNGSVQETAYYTVVYNSGNVRLYLDNLQDQLPKGFKFRGLINCIPKAAETSSGFNTSNNTWSYNSLGSYYNGFNTIYYTESRTGSSSYIPIASVSDENRQSIVYKSAQVTASVSDDVDGHQQVTFAISRYSNSDSYLKYDSSLRKYYLDPGEAIRFGYICTVEGYARTENLATNEITMPVYDKYGLGVHVSGEDVSIVPAIYRDIAVNDGGCDKTTTEEEVNGKRHVKPSWARSTTDWLSSNVSLQRLEAVPGMFKTVGGETYIASNVTILPTGIYGSKYTDGSKAGSAYTGTVARTSVVNWALRAYNEGGIGSNSMEDYWIVDTVDSPYQFTGNVFYDYYNVNGTKMTSSSVPVFSLGGRSENDTTVKISTGQGSGTLTLNGTITVNGDPVSVDGGRAQVQLLRDDETKVETLRIRMMDNYHRIPPNSYMLMYLHTQYTSNDAVLSKQFYNHVQLEPSTEFDPALVSQGKVLYRNDDGESVPYAIESGASVTMTAGYSSAARKQVTQLDQTSNTGWSDKTKNYIELPEKFSKFYYDLYVDLPKDDPTSRLVLIDALPEPGDHSPFVDRDMRDSEFVVHMLSEDLGLQVWSSANLGTGQKTALTHDQYSFEVSTKTEFDVDDWDGNGSGWSPIDLSDGMSAEETALVENARSFRVIIDDPGVVSNPANGIMGRNYQVQVRFNAELLSPEDADPGSIAWNSFGYRYTVPIGATGISTSLNAEPLKVGVLIPSVPFVVKDQKTPHNHYKNAVEDQTYRFLIYKGASIAQLNDTSGMDMSDIADILSANGRDVLITELTIRAGEATGKTDFLDEEKKWAWNGNEFEETEENWIWVNAQKYTVMELPWIDNGFGFSNIQHSPTNNYTFTQTSENNVQLRVTNVYERKGNLKISKTVAGPNFDPERKFTFTIHLQDGRYPVYGTYSYVGTNIRDGALTFDDNGNASIQLKHGQAIELQDIPEDYTYTVTESEDAWYEKQSTGESGSIVSNTTKNADFLNTRKGVTLTVKKQVTGNMGSRSQLFDFEVYITDEGRELSGDYALTITHEDGTSSASTVTFAEGAAVIRLMHGDTGVFSNLPVGARYEVDELGAQALGYEVSSTNETGTLTEAGAVTEWTNHLGSTLPTGIGAVSFTALIAGAALVAAWIVNKKRKAK